METTDEGRRFAAAVLLLHRPDARPYFASGISRQTLPNKIDNYRDNWWCPMDIQIELDSRANQDDWYSRRSNLLLNKLLRMTWAVLCSDVDTPRFLSVGLSGVWNWRGTIGKAPGPDGSRRDVKGVIADFDRILWAGRTLWQWICRVV